MEMSSPPEEARNVIRSFILSEFLPGEDASALSDLTPLITGGILDSIATIRLVSHLEDTFNISILQNEVTVNNLDTIDGIFRLLSEKLQKEC